MASRDGRTAPVPRLPYAAPRWPKGDALSFLAAGFVAASAAPLSVAVLKTLNPFLFRHLDPGKVLVPALVSGLVLSWLALNARTVLGAVGWALIGGPVAGAITAVLTALYLQALNYQAVVLTDSALLGVPFGIAFGVVLAWLAGAAVWIRTHRAHDAFDRLLVTLGIWLTTIYGSTAVALDGQLLERAAEVGLLFGAAALAAGVLRRVARIAWLERVSAGREPGWTLREWNAVQGADQLEPLFGARPLSCDAILVHVGDTPAPAYRGARAEIAVALAPGTRVRGRS
jgi:hypothetical protein